jgi:hypothetical protein
MTDVGYDAGVSEAGDALAAEAAAAAEVEPDAGGRVRYCQLPQCPNTLPADAANARIYCDDHNGRTPERRKLRRDWLKDHGINPQDEPPRVAFEVGAAGGKGKHARGAATAAELAAVEQRAKQLTQGIAVLMLIGHKDDDKRKADAADILAGTPALAAATRELAVYEPWVRKLGAGGEVSERSMAWVGFGMAAAAIAMPILVRHEVIKGGMAELAGSILNDAGPARD